MITDTISNVLVVSFLRGVCCRNMAQNLWLFEVALFNYFPEILHNFRNQITVSLLQEVVFLESLKDIGSRIVTSTLTADMDPP